MFWSSLQPVVAMVVAAAVVVVVVVVVYECVCVCVCVVCVCVCVCVCVSDSKGPDTDMLGIKLLSNLQRDNVKMISRLPGCMGM